MITRSLRPASLALFVLLAFAAVTAAPLQRASRNAPAASADDADFAAFVKSATTRSDFSSPLIDHLPRKTGVPTPKDVLGYHIGAEKKLTYWADQQKWYRALEKALPGRVKTAVIGKTEEGREIMIVYVASEANLKNLEANRANMRRLADPRGLSADEAKRTIAAHEAALPPQRRAAQRRDQYVGDADGTGLSPRGERRALHPADSRQRDRLDDADHRHRRPRSLRGLVQRLQDQRGLRRRERPTASRPTGASTCSTTTTATSTTASIRCGPT